MTREWYAQGLRFECTLCGECCTGAEGFVHFSDQEAAAIARRLNITREQFLERYTRETPVGPSLKEIPTPHGLDCIFLDRATSPGKAVCSLYEDRPTQCRTFPFWPEHIESPRAWRALGKHCEGIGRGNLVPVEAIRIDRDRQRQAQLGQPWRSL